MTFPETGAYVVPGALVPVEIDRERDEGLYVEPNVWMIHPAAKPQRHACAGGHRACVPAGSHLARRNLLCLFLSSADAAGAEWSCVGADLFERAGEGFDVGVGEVLGEVSLDSVSVVAAGALERLGAFVGEDDEDRASVVFGAERGGRVPPLPSGRRRG